MAPHHSPYVIAVEGGGYLAACDCGWNADHLCPEHSAALAEALEHLAACPELWPGAAVRAGRTVTGPRAQ